MRAARSWAPAAKGSDRRLAAPVPVQGTLLGADLPGERQGREYEEEMGPAFGPEEEPGGMRVEDEGRTV